MNEKTASRERAEPKATKARSRLGRLRIAAILVSLIALPLCLWLAAWLEHRNEPVYEGRRISQWFDDYCFRANPVAKNDPALLARIDAARKAFRSTIDSNAVPYLIRMLKTKDSRVRSTLIQIAVDIEILAPMSSRLTLPTSRRMLSAMALREMRKKAEYALPALLSIYGEQPDPDRKFPFLLAIGNIVGADRQMKPGGIEVFAENEQIVFHLARERYPQFFAESTRIYANEFSGPPANHP